MGCVSSKILTKSGSFNDCAKPSSLEELLAAKNNNGGDQILSLLCTANAVARKLKSSSQKPSLELANSISITVQETNTETYRRPYHDRVRSIRSVEEFDAMNAGASSATEVEIHGEKEANEKVSKRKAASKELRSLNVPAFEFSRTSSLREWLLVGGQVFSPGSYVTPKFGSFEVSPPAAAAEEGTPASGGAIFDPELVLEYEEDMKKLNVEEERVLKQIVESSEDVRSCNEDVKEV